MTRINWKHRSPWTLRRSFDWFRPAVIELSKRPAVRVGTGSDIFNFMYPLGSDVRTLTFHCRFNSVDADARARSRFFTRIYLSVVRLERFLRRATGPPADRESRERAAREWKQHIRRGARTLDVWQKRSTSPRAVCELKLLHISYWRINHIPSGLSSHYSC